MPGERAVSPAIGWVDVTSDDEGRRPARGGRIAIPWLVDELKAIEQAAAAGKMVRALRLIRRLLRQLTAEPKAG